MTKTKIVNISVFFVCIVLITCICGCSSKYSYTSEKELSAKLIKGEGVFVSVPEDGLYAGAEYHNSGKMTANELESALMKYTSIIKISSSCKGQDCLSQIDTDKYSYYFEPSIVHWEERATEWSGQPDRIAVSISVYDTGSKELITSQKFSGTSKWGTLGGDHPQDLLRVPLSKCLKDLYGE